MTEVILTFVMPKTAGYASVPAEPAHTRIYRYEFAGAAHAQAVIDHLVTFCEENCIAGGKLADHEED